jgi:SAM-dependent methyltransferase
MGILRSQAGLLLEHHRNHPFSGRLVQFGRQEIMFSLSDLEPLLREWKVEPANRAELAGITDRARPLTDREFFGVFGFDEITSLDYQAVAESDIVADLNRRPLPESCRGRFDVVFDGGTMEHVFHVPNLLANVVDLLAEGGRVIHTNPASNSVDHGFYCFSPCLYYEYYSANRFELEAVKLLDYGSKLRRVRITAYDYLPPIPRTALDGFLPTGNVHYVFCVARKTALSSSDEIPQQGFYAGLWQRKQQDERKGSGAPPPGSPAQGGGALAGLKRWVKSRPGFERRLRSLLTPLLRLDRIREARMALGARRQRYR